VFWGLLSIIEFSLQTTLFCEWAIVDSNHWPLPRQRSTILCWRFLQHAKLLQIGVFVRWRISRHFRRFTRVAARLLHRCDGLHLHKVREDRYSTSRLEPPYASFVLGAFPKVSSRSRRPQRAKWVRTRIAYATARNARVTVKMPPLLCAPSTDRGYDLLVSNGTEVSTFLPPPHQRNM
jgi:hypothetical protein